MILGLLATLAIVAQDHTILRAAPAANAAVLTTLSQGDMLEVRDERTGYLKVYDYRRERGGYVRSDMARQLDTSERSAPELLAVLRFLRDSPGAEALGISYGAAYLKAVPAKSLSAEPFDAIGRMAERLAEAASSNSGHAAEAAAHLETVGQYGVRVRSFERNGRMMVCYDGELFRRVLAQRGADAEARARAVLALTRPDCIDPDLTPSARNRLDEERRDLLETVDVVNTDEMTRSRVLARRAGVWASIAFERSRSGDQAQAAAGRAYAELIAVRAQDLGIDRRAEYLDALLRVGAIGWPKESAAAKAIQFSYSASPGEPGQTCISIASLRHHPEVALIRRCTYGTVWPSSVREIPQASALVLAVQPLDGWRELWVFHERSGAWVVDVITPGADTPELGYVEFAGYAPNTRRLLVAREVQVQGRFQRHFEEFRLDDMALVRQASSPDLLRDFGQWQDAAWRQGTLTLH